PTCSALFPYTTLFRSFEWSRSLDDPNEYVLVEAFRDGDAGGEHVNSAHFKAAQQTLPPYLQETPRVVNTTVDQDDWSELGEMARSEEHTSELQSRENL